ncbi:hypothetical protein E5345_09630 [Propionibacterium sp. NM47_B9-13]|uniref:Glycoside hydrolase family 2 catalytic domain-containing protein n=2 Tax=Cutibacterium modestum TaxID=2559073 RepID=A0AAD1NXA4_9ACTN|nr:hypothetical protein BCB70_06675 [Cutibacterium modestum]EFS72912.1 hypothetical protein HMPREF9621_02815 [Cutibacterium modestum HL037PA2]EFS93000.1 hypothetical protein HMPREF9607_00851 [Cutibacterium modestum HL044PA1]EFT14978.1 hypothetical protein HMPREF9622_01945 [Cutibacterium modestum HL037PA3]EGG25544.1 glycosyl hydrolase family 2, TIM barrel domain protein [Cutibacterium modestum P08]TGY28316.1 hypothetical protein E5345_09630 [Propionibacterium sp. NM47_B9-13]
MDRGKLAAHPHYTYSEHILDYADRHGLLVIDETPVEVLKMNERVFDSFDAVIGEQIWNFADFAITNGTMRIGGNRKGLHPGSPAQVGRAPVPQEVARYRGMIPAHSQSSAHESKCPYAHPRSGRLPV